jgi:hypothetical protein
MSRSSSASSGVIEACLLLLKFGETLEFLIVQKFGHDIHRIRRPQLPAAVVLRGPLF